MGRRNGNETAFENVKTTVRKGRMLLAGFVACMGSERRPRGAVLGELEGGKDNLGGHEKDSTGCLERNLSLCTFPI